MIVFALGSFQYGSGIISSLLLALSPPERGGVHGGDDVCRHGAVGAHGVVTLAQPERSLSWD